MKKTVLIVSIFLLLASVCSYAQDQQKNMLDLAAKLESCEVYTQKFIHPFTGESLERKIEGLVGTRVELSLGDKKQEAKYTYTINEKEVENPLQECLDNGICTISGY